MMTGMITLLLTGLLRVLRTRRALVLENLALRHQLAVLQRTAPRPRLRPSDRLFCVLLARLWHGWAEAVSIVQPETVIRWQRAGFTLFGPGRAAGTGQAARASPRRSERLSDECRVPPLLGRAPDFVARTYGFGGSKAA
jgi:hypothetical protein